jgi:3-isopropylmalate dehydrogenase
MVIPGDHIGPEIVQATVQVLQALERTRGGFHLALEYHQAGAGHFKKTGHAISAETLERCRTADAILKGPVGDPSVRHPDGTEAGILGGILRNGLDLYANVRPIRLFPGVKPPLKLEPGQVDYVIVRENTEGLYLSRGLGVGNDRAVADTLLMTREGVERVCRFAFELARTRKGAPRDGARRVTCVDKSNVLRSFAFFRRIFTEVGKGYPDAEKDYLYSDAAAQALVLEPSRFDVLVMENFLGDLLSDLGGATVGGIGLCPSGNYGDRLAYFEPIHGSAPSLAGQGRANPIAQLLSAGMMLAKLGEGEAARRLEQAVWRALESGRLSIGRDGCPVGGTHAAAEAVIQALEEGD